MQEVAVVIPNYNGIGFLKECLKSLFFGDLIPEIIVVDNGSADGSAEWVAKQYPQVELICFEENTGFCRAVNAGIEKAETKYVILLNNDTVVDPGFVTALVETIGKDERIFSAGAKMLCLSEPEKIDDAGDYYCALGWAFASGKNKPSTGFNKEKRVFAACAGAAIYRKSMIEELGYFDEAHFAYLEDIDIGYRAQLKGYYNLFAPKAEVLHAGSGASGSRYNDFKTDLTSRNSIYLIYKNMPFLQILLNLPFLLIGFGIKFLFFLLKGMGVRYLKGLWQGIKLSASEKGKSKRIRFKWRNIGYYVRIQGQLYWNIFRRVWIL